MDGTTSPDGVLAFVALVATEDGTTGPFAFGVVPLLAGVVFEDVAASLVTALVLESFETILGYGVVVVPLLAGVVFEDAVAFAAFGNFPTVALLMDAFAIVCELPSEEFEGALAGGLETTATVGIFGFSIDFCIVVKMGASTALLEAFESEIGGATASLLAAEAALKAAVEAGIEMAGAEVFAEAPMVSFGVTSPPSLSEGFEGASAATMFLASPLVSVVVSDVNFSGLPSLFSLLPLALISVVSAIVRLEWSRCRALSLWF